jgi:hypothetical protein
MLWTDLNPKPIAHFPSPGIVKTARSIALSIPLFAALACPKTAATVPEQARIDEIIGNSSELLIRRNGQREPTQTNSILQQVRDALITDPPNNARALLRFLSGTGKDLNMYVQTNTHPDAAIYYFPCQLQGGDYLIGWGLARNESRGCENGVVVQRGRSASAGLSTQPTIAQLKQRSIAQGRTQQVFYCSVEGNGGKGWLAMTTSGDPCDKAQEQCRSGGGGQCTPVTVGSWWTIEPELHATVECANGQSSIVDATGETMETQVQQLWQQAQTQGRSCGLQVYRPQDFVILPASDEIVSAQGDDEILVQTRDTEEGLRVDVLAGAINVRSSDSQEDRLVTTGQRYIRSENEGEVTTFDRERALKSIDLEILCAFASYPENQLDVSACSALDPGVLTQLDPNINYTTQSQIQFCDREQASGGNQGDRRTLQMTTNQGKVEIEYEMYSVPDRLQLIYEGEEILDTGFISGSGSLSVPFQGNSGRLDVVLTGNTTTSTQWNYQLFCP